MSIEEDKQKKLFAEPHFIYDKKGNKHPIDNDIGKLLNKKKNQYVTEEEILPILSKYNLKDTLILIGNYSRYIYHENTDHFGNIGHIEESTGILITQIMLAYLANLIIISGADNKQTKSFSTDPYSFLALCTIYNNKLITPELANPKKKYPFNKISFMVRMWYAQISNKQINPKYLLTRNIILFNHLAKTITPKKFAKLSDIFLKENGITIDEYIKIGFGFYVGTRTHSIFQSTYLSNAKIKALKKIFTEEKVNNFINLVATNYQQFNQLDKLLNENIDPIYTRNRFNPLYTYPFIEETTDNNDNMYIIPNVTAFINKTFGGLFWWFHNYFEQANKKKKLHLDFRNFFGNDIFEEYVGLILKDIYGEQYVTPEITYSKQNNKFTDWQVLKDNKCYLFEAKANQFALLSKQTGDIETIINNELPKVVDAIVETYKNINDIDKFEELKHFRGKEIIPIIIFWEMPLISTDLYKQEINILLAKKEKENKKELSGLTDFKYHLLNIDELEFYSSVKDKIDIEKIFDKTKNNKNEGFTPYITKINNNKRPNNNYLDKTYNNFFDPYTTNSQSTKINNKIS